MFTARHLTPFTFAFILDAHVYHPRRTGRPKIKWADHARDLLWSYLVKAGLAEGPLDRSEALRAVWDIDSNVYTLKNLISQSHQHRPPEPLGDPEEDALLLDWTTGHGLHYDNYPSPESPPSSSSSPTPPSPPPPIEAPSVSQQFRRPDIPWTTLHSLPAFPLHPRQAWKRSFASPSCSSSDNYLCMPLTKTDYLT